MYDGKDKNLEEDLSCILTNNKLTKVFCIVDKDNNVGQDELEDSGDAQEEHGHKEGSSGEETE